MTQFDIIERFADLRVLVLGEAMLDSYLGGQVDRLCREAPVPIVALGDRSDALGGAANTAAAARALGAETAFLSVIGDDETGATLRGELDRAGVDASSVLTVPSRATLLKQRINGNGQLLLRLDSGSEADVDTVSERRLLDALDERWGQVDAVIVSDYGYGVLTPAMVARIGELQRRSPRVLAVDSKNLARWRDADVTFAKPNYAEAAALLGSAAVEGTRERVEQIASAEAALFERTGAHVVAVTLDVAGAVVFEAGQPAYRTFTQPVPNCQAAGAGDSFCATFALALAAGAHGPAAADLASAAASINVAQGGTSVCSAALLRETIAGDRKVAGAASLAARVANWRASGRRVVFTNGCFDILHRGHISYLNRAKALGDVLVVGLNSDASVSALKGPSRPINAQADRAGVLAALSCVDLVVVFEEETPIALIETIRPHVFVKGGDYTIETLPEAPTVIALGGEVKLMPFLQDRSTTSMIERIRRQAEPDVDEAAIA